MKKLKLHWQILIALILAIIYGILFPTEYEVRENSFKVFTRRGVSTEVTDQLKSIENKVFHTQKAFEAAVIESIGANQYKANSTSILIAAYKNEAVSAVSWMGELFLRALKMIIIPLILSSLISGITNIGSGEIWAALA